MEKQLQSPEVTISVEETIEAIRKSFIQQGIMKPLQLQDFILEIDPQLDAYRDAYTKLLRESWSADFPGVPYDGRKLEEEVNKAIEKKKQSLVAEFEQMLQENVRHTRFTTQWCEEKISLLLRGMLLSCMIMPTSLFFEIGNISFKIGYLGIALSGICIIFLLLMEDICNEKPVYTKASDTVNRAAVKKH